MQKVQVIVSSKAQHVLPEGSGLVSTEGSFVLAFFAAVVVAIFIIVEIVLVFIILELLSSIGLVVVGKAMTITKLFEHLAFAFLIARVFIGSSAPFITAFIIHFTRSVSNGGAF